MRNKVIIITSRFGSTSDFFDLWLESARRNQEFDFLILTDIDINFKSENIVLKKYSSFDNFTNEIDKRIGYKTRISSPFKTADLRPAYAALFKNIIQNTYWERYNTNGNYDFWGYVDTDLILGNLTHFINDVALDNCDVFQTWGHFTLIRNFEMINNLYRKPYKSYSMKKSIRLPENCMLEEGPFLLQLKDAGARIDSRVSRICDIKRNVFNFTVDGVNYRNQKFVYLNGEIRRLAENNDGKTINDEFMYIHFMKRVMKKIPKNCYNLILTENGIFPYNESEIFKERFSNDALENWGKFTCTTLDSRYKKVSLGYKLFHLNNWIYRRETKNIEMEKRKLIKVYYGL